MLAKDLIYSKKKPDHALKLFEIGTILCTLPVSGCHGKDLMCGKLQYFFDWFIFILRVRLHLPQIRGQDLSGLLGAGGDVQLQGPRDTFHTFQDVGRSFDVYQVFVEVFIT